ncbi:hypothetical protein GCM10009759_24060 [Kitasatospora saccharophila]|uniref:Glycosyltransferase RgtA/B/C/D-like domain-containing protein n=1 Tax=Kitasatospora saccharophila TaxID=407973 RepID=A0ABN2WMK7_9ACTN
MAQTAMGIDVADGSTRVGRRIGRRSLPLYLCWAPPALLTLVLGVLGSNRPPMWGDELASWVAADRSVPQLVAMLRHIDGVYGVYYLFLHFWIGLFGDSAVSLRLPSALAMAGAAAFIALTGRKQFSGRAGLLAGLVFAVIPAVSRYSQEVRAYALVMCAVAASTWLLLRALERPGVWRWFGYGVSVTFVGWFQLVALTVLLPHLLVILLQYPRVRPGRRVLEFALTAGVAVLPVLPLVLLGRRQVGKQISWISRPTPDSIPALWDAMYGPALVALPVLVLAAMTLGWPSNRRRVVQVLLIGVVPVFAVYLVSLGGTSYFIARYLMFTLIAWTVLAGAALAAVRPRFLGFVAIGLLGVASISAQQGIRQPTDRVNYDERAAAAVVAAGYRPGDGLVVPHDRTIFDASIKFYLPDDVRPRDVFQAASPAEASDLVTRNCPDPVACLGEEQRIWLVTLGGDLPQGAKEPYAQQNLDKAQQDALNSRYHVVKTTRVYNVWVTLMERN